MIGLIVGLATAFNFLIIIKKIQMGRGVDASLDIGFVMVFVWIFGDTGQLGMVVAMTASVVVSIALFFMPIEIDFDDDDDDDYLDDNASYADRMDSAFK